MIRLTSSSFLSSNLLNTSQARLLVMSKCTVSPPFRTESSSLVIYPCRLWEPFVSSELGICGCQGQEADFEHYFMDPI